MEIFFDLVRGLFGWQPPEITKALGDIIVTLEYLIKLSSSSSKVILFSSLQMLESSLYKMIDLSRISIIVVLCGPVRKGLGKENEK